MLRLAIITGACCAAALASPPSPAAALRAALAAGQAPPARVVTYDLRYAYALSAVAGYEEVALVAALAGLANRAAPVLLLDLEPPDAAWLASATARGGWLENTTLDAVAPPVENLVSQLAAGAGVRGACVYDPLVTSTSAVANTAAGAEDLLPVAFRPADASSLYARLVAGGPRLPVARSLVGLFNGSVTGSVKRDVYTWAVDTFIKTGKSDAAHLAYYVDYFWTLNPASAAAGSRRATESSAAPMHYWARAGADGEAAEGGDIGWEKATLPNACFAVARRAFFFDLSVWSDESPVDEPTQPLGADLAAFRYMLGAAYNQTAGAAIIRMHGFTPWAYKYVTPHGKHGGVEAEWATGKIISAFNAVADADACCIGNMANAAFWASFPLADRYVQAPPPSRAALTARGLLAANGSVVGHRLYFMFYAGDYDSAAWVYSQLQERWADPARGSVPIGWGVDPGLASRFPPIWPLLFGSADAAADVIITGDSGAGYLNPTMLYDPARAAESGLPSGLAPWVALNTALNRQFGLKFTGFSISADAPQPAASDDAVFASFSSHGVVNQGWPDLTAYLNVNLPVITQTDLSADVGSAAATVASYAHPADAAPQWKMFRSVLTSPTFLAAVAANATAVSGGAAVPVTPLELAALMRVELGGSNDNFVSYVADSLPPAAPAGALLRFNATVRNDGWNVLSASNHGLVVSAASLQRLAAARGLARAEWAAAGLVALDAAEGVTQAARRSLARAGFLGRGARESLAGAAAGVFPLPSDLVVGGSVVVQATVQLPALAAGEDAGAIVDIVYQLAELDASGGVAKTFDAYGNIAWSASVVVATP